MVRPASSAAAAMIRFGIEGARGWPLFAKQQLHLECPVLGGRRQLLDWHHRDRRGLEHRASLDGPVAPG